MCQSHVAADHKHVQSNGFDPQHGGAMTSMHKVYTKITESLRKVGTYRLFVTHITSKLLHKIYH